MITLLSMFAFMLIPIWIPVITVSLGALSDLLRRPRHLTTTRVPELIKEPS